MPAQNPARTRRSSGRRTPRLELLEDRTVPAIVLDGSFESHDVPSEHAEYNPPGTPWTFNSRSGIIEIMESERVDEAPRPTPDGSQAAFLQYEIYSSNTIGQFGQN